jgi:hypothetical protein
MMRLILTHTKIKKKRIDKKITVLNLIELSVPVVFILETKKKF